jgi:transposase InsO family protein
MDAYSRKIIGWSVHKTLEAKGPIAALEMALAERGGPDKPLIHHSDRDGPPLRRSVLLRCVCQSITQSQNHHQHDRVR